MASVREGTGQLGERGGSRVEAHEHSAPLISRTAHIAQGRVPGDGRVDRSADGSLHVLPLLGAAVGMAGGCQADRHSEHRDATLGALHVAHWLLQDTAGGQRGRDPPRGSKPLPRGRRRRCRHVIGVARAGRWARWWALWQWLAVRRAGRLGLLGGPRGGPHGGLGGGLGGLPGGPSGGLCGGLHGVSCMARLRRRARIRALRCRWHGDVELSESFP